MQVTRRVVRYILFAICFGNLSIVNIAGAAERPNVLWIYLEDVSGWFSCYGDTVIETPNIDALAASGTRFDRFYTPAGVCSATRSAIVTGMMQTSIGAHNHRSCRATFRGKSMGEYDKNVLPADVVPLPIRMRQAGYWTFNEGGKDDYNFEWDVNEFYDFVRNRGGWAPASFIAGDCLKGKKPNQPFFGQLQLGGGKLGNRTPQVVDRDAVPVPPYYPDVPIVREEIAHHYDCLIKTDQQVGEVIAALKRQGVYENTLIFMFSDHGYKLHRHKQMLYEGGIHMPMVVAGPGIDAGKVRGDLISGIDVTAASCAAAGISVPPVMEGRDFLASDFEPRQYVVAARDRCDYTIEKIRAVVTPRFKYLKNYLTDRPYMQPTYKDPWEVTQKFRDMMAKGEMNETQLLLFGDKRVPEEFYDLENDPHEIHNLADDPRFAEELARHRKYLADWIAATGDRGQEPESDIGLICALKRWGDKCVNPEYDRVRNAVSKANRGTLIFADDFQRNESQEKKDEVGKGWGTNSAKRAGGNKQVDLRDGAMYIYIHKDADHGVSVTHPAEFRDGTVAMRFMLEHKDDTLGLNFADLQCKEVWAGHLFKVTVGVKQTEIADLKTGAMNLETRELRRAKKLTPTQQKELKTKAKRFPKPLETGRWYTIEAKVVGDQLSVSIDDKLVGTFTSEGIAHPTKRMLRLAIHRNVVVDDVKIYSLAN